MSSKKGLKLLIKWPGGQQRGSLPKGSTLRDLKKLIRELDSSEQYDISFGFPPRLVEETDESVPLSAIGIKSGVLTRLCILHCGH